MITKEILINRVTPDTNIADLKASAPKHWLAIKNLGDGSKDLINSVFPPKPVQAWELRVTLSGNPSVANDVLASHYHVIMPVDPLLYYLFSSVSLNACFITAKVAPSATSLSVDVKVLQKMGTTFKSLFQSSFNPILPKSIKTTHNVKFAINSLFQDDILRVDVLVTDVSVSGIELVLQGNYVLTENS
jgi:hypothetical protein